MGPKWRSSPIRALPITTGMRTGEATRGIRRRTVSWDPDTAVLVVGKRSTVVHCAPGDNECLLRLSERQAAELHSTLRRRHRITAAVGLGLLATVPTASAAVATVGTAGVAAAETTSTTVTTEVADADKPFDGPLTVVAASEAPPVEPEAQAADPAPAPDPQPAATPDDDGHGTDIGWTVTYEQDPDYVPPDGVEIGSSMVLERDPAPAADPATPPPGP